MLETVAIYISDSLLSYFSLARITRHQSDKPQTSSMTSRKSRIIFSHANEIC
jgi:hypothetical protein